MLKQRIITAVVLLLFLLPALFHSETLYWRLITLVLIAAAAWEWGRLNGLQPAASMLGGALALGVCLAAWSAGLPGQRLMLVWTISGAAWVLAGTGLLKQGVPAWSRLPVWLRLVGGWAALCVTWLAVVQAREIGVVFLLSILLLVWMADVAAYFAGKGLGGRWVKFRLAPGISPGKSWEGALGGLLGVLILAGVWLGLEARGVLGRPSIYGVLWAQGGVVLLLIGALFLTAMSIVGDLVESLVKRSAGVKDSSGLLPGHGGVLDRVDALLPTLPLAMMLYTAVS